MCVSSLYILQKLVAGFKAACAKASNHFFLSLTSFIRPWHTCHTFTRPVLWCAWCSFEAHVTWSAARPTTLRFGEFIGCCSCTVHTISATCRRQDMKLYQTKRSEGKNKLHKPRVKISLLLFLFNIFFSRGPKLSEDEKSAFLQRSSPADTGCWERLRMVAAGLFPWSACLRSDCVCFNRLI